jgi:galactose-1-phosphate uridylyltransferase
MKICNCCSQSKHPKDFRRYATLAQSRIWTRNPHMKRPIRYESSTCNECAKSKRTPTLKLSPENARRRMVNEGEHNLVIEQTVQRIRENSLKRKRVTILKNRQALFAEDYERIYKELDRMKKRAQRAGGGEILSKVLLANEIFKRLKNEGKKVPMRWEELLSKKFGTLCPK